MVTTERHGARIGIGDVADQVKAYAKQQLVDPFRSLGRLLGLGIAGSLCMAIGILLLALGVLRAIQTEADDVFDGNWSFVPYLIVLVPIGIAMALIGSRITKGVDDA